MQAGWVPPVDPTRRGELDRGGGLPGGPGEDRLGLVEPVDGFCESVVLGLPDGADRRRHLRDHDRVCVGQRHVLGPRSK
mgnify:CR=1 FL=1